MFRVDIILRLIGSGTGSVVLPRVSGLHVICVLFKVDPGRRANPKEQLILGNKEKIFLRRPSCCLCL